MKENAISHTPERKACAISVEWSILICLLTEAKKKNKIYVNQSGAEWEARRKWQIGKFNAKCFSPVRPEKLLLMCSNNNNNEENKNGIAP